MSEYRFAVRVKPGAPHTVVGGCWAGRFGPALVVAVPARAVDGKANDAVCRALADALGVAPGHVTIGTGAHARDKLVTIEPAPAGLATRINELTSGVTNT